jgi:hypothetical protein
MRLRSGWKFGVTVQNLVFGRPRKVAIPSDIDAGVRLRYEVNRKIARHSIRSSAILWHLRCIAPFNDYQHALVLWAMD